MSTIFSFPKPVNEKAVRVVAGVIMLLSALVLATSWYWLLAVLADALIVALIVAAGLESLFALCLGCRLFAVLMRLGVVPARICIECADISSRAI